MRRSGFTMIELIFVIVILGILAAVAIPKLTATRDDAKISKAATEISGAVTDIGSYYTGNGDFSLDNNWSKMTNVKLVAATATGDSNVTVYRVTKDKDCITLNAGSDGNLTIKPSVDGDTTGGKADSKKVCTELLKTVKPILKSHIFGGSSLNRDN